MGQSPPHAACWPATHPRPPTPPALLCQLCKDFHAGNMPRHEYDVNIDCGFVKRTHAPLVPAARAV